MMDVSETARNDDDDDDSGCPIWPSCRRGELGLGPCTGSGPSCEIRTFMSAVRDPDCPNLVTLTIDSDPDCFSVPVVAITVCLSDLAEALAAAERELAATRARDDDQTALTLQRVLDGPHG